MTLGPGDCQHVPESSRGIAVVAVVVVLRIDEGSLLIISDIILW